MDKNTINRVLQQKATEQEAVKVAQWLGEAEGQLAAADMIDVDMEELVPHWDAMAQDARARINNKVSQWWRVAAVVTLVLTLGVSAMWLTERMLQPEVVMQTVCAPRGEQKQVVLQDGTLIYLNAGSELTFPSRFTAQCREVQLVGEAYFEVQKDEHRPFMVELNGVAVEVLGTKFDVRSYEGEQVQVNLDEGHVVFHSDRHKVDMQAGERLSYDRSTSTTTLYHNADTYMASAWKEHKVAVSEMPMQELKALLERRYDVEIRVLDAECNQYRYSLEASDHNLRAILKRMSYVSPILYHYDEERGYVQIRVRN